jgi:hypothetical protein
MATATAGASRLGQTPRAEPVSRLAPHDSLLPREPSALSTPMLRSSPSNTWFPLPVTAARLAPRERRAPARLFRLACIGCSPGVARRQSDAADQNVQRGVLWFQHVALSRESDAEAAPRRLERNGTPNPALAGEASNSRRRAGHQTSKAEWRSGPSGEGQECRAGAGRSQGSPLARARSGADIPVCPGAGAVLVGPVLFSGYA